MTSTVHTQGQKDGYFFVRLTADSLHSVVRKIKSERMGEAFTVPLLNLLIPFKKER
jgi:hypothetical protein